MRPRRLIARSLQRRPRTPPARGSTAFSSPPPSYRSRSSNAPAAGFAGFPPPRHIFPVAELIAGIVADPQFGPLLLVGLGGIFVEALADFALRMPTIDFDDAVDMLSELRGKAVLEGAGGMPRADLHAAAACLVRMGGLAVELGSRLAAVDVNPLFVLADGDGVLAGDALVVLK